MENTIVDQQLKRFFETETLPFPPVPEGLLAQLKPCGPQNWATKGDCPSPADLPARIREVRQAAADRAEVGFFGHGINSWLLYCYVMQGPLGLFLQCRWGNAYDDVERARQRIEGVFGLAGVLLQTVQEAAVKHRLPADERLIVCFTDHFPSRWQWASEGEGWHEDGDFSLLAALQSLRERT
jgi:hypothetical protein